MRAGRRCEREVAVIVSEFTNRAESKPLKLFHFSDRLTEQQQENAKKRQQHLHYFACHSRNKFTIEPSKMRKQLCICHFRKFMSPLWAAQWEESEAIDSEWRWTGRVNCKLILKLFDCFSSCSYNDARCMMMREIEIWSPLSTVTTSRCINPFNVKQLSHNKWKTASMTFHYCTFPFQSLAFFSSADSFSPAGGISLKMKSESWTAREN